jgi:hypothetical protein
MKMELELELFYMLKMPQLIIWMPLSVSKKISRVMNACAGRKKNRGDNPNCRENALRSYSAKIRGGKLWKATIKN